MKNRYLDKEGTIRISTDIPVPQEGVWSPETREDHRISQTPVGRPVKYDVRRLDIGDSFLYDKDRYMFHGHACYWKLITGYKFDFIETPEGNRVWRVA